MLDSGLGVVNTLGSGDGAEIAQDSLMNGEHR